MEMGKLTAKLRDAVPVCLLVEGREIKRYKNIEIPDDLKKLEYIDFKFDVPLNGTITFKIMFEPGVLPAELPMERERRTKTSKITSVVVVGEVPVAAQSEKALGIDADSMEVRNKSTALITIEGTPAIEILENTTLVMAAWESTTSREEVNTVEEAPFEEVKAEPEGKMATPAKKTPIKAKKAPTVKKESIE